MINELDDDGMGNISVNDCRHKFCICLSVVLINWMCELNASRLYIFAGLPFSVFPHNDIDVFFSFLSMTHMFRKLKYDICAYP